MATDRNPQYSMKGTMDHRSTTRAVHSRAPRLMAGLVLAVSMVLAGPSAEARKNSGEVEKNGCRGDSTSKVKLKAEPDGTGVTKATAVVFSEDDDVWDWRLRRNDDLVAKGSVKAKDADRSFRIIRTLIDPAGPDEISFRAENTVTGEVCAISVTY